MCEPTTAAAVNVDNDGTDTCLKSMPLSETKTCPRSPTMTANDSASMSNSTDCSTNGAINASSACAIDTLLNAKDAATYAVMVLLIVNHSPFNYSVLHIKTVGNANRLMCKAISVYLLVATLEV